LDKFKVFETNEDGATEGDEDEQVGVNIIRRALKSRCARSPRTPAKKAR